MQYQICHKRCKNGKQAFQKFKPSSSPGPPRSSSTRKRIFARHSCRISLGFSDLKQGTKKGGITPPQRRNCVSGKGSPLSSSWFLVVSSVNKLSSASSSLSTFSGTPAACIKSRNVGVNPFKLSMIWKAEGLSSITMASGPKPFQAKASSFPALKRTPKGEFLKK